MLDGDEQTAFAFFAGLCKVLETCGVLSLDESKADLEEYTSYVVERRKDHASSGQSASDIIDVAQHLLLDFGFQARHRVLRVFKLSYLFVGMPVCEYPAISFDLSGSALDSRTFHDCLRLVQTYVMSAGCSPQRFFSDQALGSVRKAVSTAGVFFVTEGFNLWKDFCRTSSDAFVKQYVYLYTAFFAQCRRAFDAEYNACNALTVWHIRIPGTRPQVNCHAQEAAVMSQVQVVLWLQYFRKRKWMLAVRVLRQ